MLERRPRTRGSSIQAVEQHSPAGRRSTGWKLGSKLGNHGTFDQVAHEGSTTNRQGMEITQREAQVNTLANDGGDAPANNSTLNGGTIETQKQASASPDCVRGRTIKVDDSAPAGMGGPFDLQRSPAYAGFSQLQIQKHRELQNARDFYLQQQDQMKKM